MKHVDGRYHYFDNARALLVLLVVLGHFLEPTRHVSPLMKTMYLFIYSFHVPGLAFLSGFLSKHYNKDGKTRELIGRFLFPYIIFEVLFYLFAKYAFGYKIQLDLFYPFHALWYLLSIFFWYMLLPYFLTFRFPVLATLIVAIAVGYFDSVGQYLSLSRTLLYFPFFMLGHALDMSFIDRIRMKWVQVASFVFLVILFALFYQTSHLIDDRWFRGVFSYGDLDHNEWYAFVIRFGMLALNALATFSFFSLLPDGASFLSGFGRRTMYPFILHIFVYYFVYATTLKETTLGVNKLLPLVTGLSISCYSLFSLNVTRKIFMPLIEPRAKFFLK